MRSSHSLALNKCDAVSEACERGGGKLLRNCSRLSEFMLFHNFLGDKFLDSLTVYGTAFVSWREILRARTEQLPCCSIKRFSFELATPSPTSCQAPTSWKTDETVNQFYTKKFNRHLAQVQETLGNAALALSCHRISGRILDACLWIVYDPTS